MPQILFFGCIIKDVDQFFENFKMVCYNSEMFVEYKIYRLIPVIPEEPEEEDVDMDTPKKEKPIEYTKKLVRKGITTNNHYESILREITCDVDESEIETQIKFCDQDQVSMVVTSMTKIKKLRLIDDLGFPKVHLETVEHKDGKSVWMLVVDETYSVNTSAVNQLQSVKNINTKILQSQYDVLAKMLDLPSARLCYVDIG